jgi:hypothetical protein
MIERVRALIANPKSEGEKAAAERKLAVLLEKVQDESGLQARDEQGRSTGVYGNRRYGSKANSASVAVTEIAKWIREDIKLARKLAAARYPAGALVTPTGFEGVPKEVKISVTCRHHTSINVTVKNLPEGWGWFEGTSPHSFAWSPETIVRRASAPLLRLRRALEEIHGSYNWDGSDAMRDHFDVRYYGGVELEYDPNNRIEFPRGIGDREIQEAEELHPTRYPGVSSRLVAHHKVSLQGPGAISFVMSGKDAEEELRAFASRSRTDPGQVVVGTVSSSGIWDEDAVPLPESAGSDGQRALIVDHLDRWVRRLNVARTNPAATMLTGLQHEFATAHIGELIVGRDFMAGLLPDDAPQRRNLTALADLPDPVLTAPVEKPEPEPVAAEPETEKHDGVNGRVLRVEHKPATGTLILDTERSDTAARAVFKKHRIRWSNNIGEDGAWYLRASRDKPANRSNINTLVHDLVEAGYGVRVSIDNAAYRSVAETEADRAERAESRAERFGDRADRAAEKSAALNEAAERRREHIPLGQPLLTDHYSYGRHKRYRERTFRMDEQSWEESKKARDLADRADAVEANQRHRESVPVTLRRIEGLEAEKRRFERELTDPDASSQYRHLVKQIDYWKAHVAEAEAAGVKVWGPDDFEVGDFALINGTWCEVLRVNKKSLTTPAIIGRDWRVNGLDICTKARSGLSWTDTRPYDNVSGRKAADDPEIVAALTKLDDTTT